MKFKYNNEWLNLKVPLAIPVSSLDTTLTISEGNTEGEATIDMPSGYTFTNCHVVSCSYKLSTDTSRIGDSGIYFSEMDNDKVYVKITLDAATEADTTFNVYITLMKVNSTENGIDTYTTTETRIGTWIDGKPLYRKVYSFTDTIAGPTTFSKAHGLSNIAMVRVASAFLFSVSGSSYLRAYNLPLVGYEGNTTDKAYCYVDKTNINIFSTGGWSTGWTKFVILEYTKTTD